MILENRRYNLFFFGKSKKIKCKFSENAQKKIFSENQTDNLLFFRKIDINLIVNFQKIHKKKLRKNKKADLLFLENGSKLSSWKIENFS